MPVHLAVPSKPAVGERPWGSARGPLLKLRFRRLWSPQGLARFASTGQPESLCPARGARGLVLPSAFGRDGKDKERRGRGGARGPTRGVAIAATGGGQGSHGDLSPEVQQRWSLCIGVWQLPSCHVCPTSHSPPDKPQYPHCTVQGVQHSGSRKRDIQNPTVGSRSPPEALSIVVTPLHMAASAPARAAASFLLSTRSTAPDVP